MFIHILFVSSPSSQDISLITLSLKAWAAPSPSLELPLLVLATSSRSKSPPPQGYVEGWHSLQVSTTRLFWSGYNFSSQMNIYYKFIPHKKKINYKFMTKARSWWRVRRRCTSMTTDFLVVFFFFCSRVQTKKGEESGTDSNGRLKKRLDSTINCPVSSSMKISCDCPILISCSYTWPTYVRSATKPRIRSRFSIMARLTCWGHARTCLSGLRSHEHQACIINAQEIGGLSMLSFSRIKLAEPLLKIIHHLNFFFLGKLTVPPVCTVCHA